MVLKHAESYSQKRGPNGDSSYAHVEVYRFTMNPSLPSYCEIHHKCGNPGCLRPTHLKEVTPEMHKRIEKERREIRKNLSKLDTQTVVRIQAKLDTVKELSKEYPELTEEQIWAIRIAGNKSVS
jgi:hypothetical protein